MPAIKTLFKPTDPTKYIDLPVELNIDNLQITVPEGMEPPKTVVNMELMAEIIRRLSSIIAGEDITWQTDDIKLVDDKCLDAEIADSQVMN